MRFAIVLLLAVLAAGCAAQDMPADVDTPEEPGLSQPVSATGSETATPAAEQERPASREAALNDDSHGGATEGLRVSTGGEQEATGQPSLPSCGTETALLTVAPLASADFTSIMPLGLLAPPAHTFPAPHVYFHLPRQAPNDYVNSPLIAPADAVVTRITTDENLSADPPTAEFDVYFSPCQEFEAYFLHVSTIAPKLAAAFGPPFDVCHEPETKGMRYRKCDKAVHVPVEAGEQIGTAGGIRTQNALDLGARDTRVPELPYANPARWPGYLQVVCPLDYFTPDIRDALKGRLGYAGAVRTAEPICGSIEQDEPGTAQGAWLAEGVDRPRPSDPHLSLMHDPVDPAIGVFSVGTTAERVGLPWGLYYFEPADTGLVDREFAQVAADGNVYCYETERRSSGRVEARAALLVRLTSAGRLQLDQLEGETCVAGPWTLEEPVAYQR